MSTWVMYKGDTLPKLAATLVPAPGQTVDLLAGGGATVVFRMHEISNVDDAVVEAPATVLDATRVEYAWVPADTDVAGTFDCRFIVTFPGGAVESFPNDREFRVRIKEG